MQEGAAMNTPTTTESVRRLVSIHRREKARGAARVISLLLRLASAALLAWVGYIHFHLWQEGYRQIPVDGPFFLIGAVAAVVFAAALLAWPRPLAGLLAAGFTASAIAALVISLTVGLFGFHESAHASFVVQSLVLEAAATVVLLVWAVVTAAGAPLAGERDGYLARTAPWRCR